MTDPAAVAACREDADPAAQQALKTALRLLQRRQLAARELQTRLGDRGHAPSACAAAVAACQGFGYVNDTELAAALLRKAQHDGRGRRWLQRKLQQRQLEGAAAAAALAQLHAEPNAAQTAARAALQRRFGRCPLPAERQARQRLQQRMLRFLLGRGFDGAAGWAALQAFDPTADAEPEELPC